MARRQRECYLCGESYKYCGSCSQDRVKPSWMAEFHSENCKNIFDICTRFNMDMMSKTEAQEALNSCDLSNKDNFKSYVKRDLENIFAEEKVADVEEEAIVEAVPVRNKFKKSHVVVEQENE